MVDSSVPLCPLSLVHAAPKQGVRVVKKATRSCAGGID